MPIYINLYLFFCKYLNPKPMKRIYSVLLILFSISIYTFGQTCCPVKEEQGTKCAFTYESDNIVLDTYSAPSPTFNATAEYVTHGINIMGIILQVRGHTISFYAFERKPQDLALLMIIFSCIFGLGIQRMECRNNILMD